LLIGETTYEYNTGRDRFFDIWELLNLARCVILLGLIKSTRMREGEHKTHMSTQFRLLLRFMSLLQAGYTESF